jgi:hypothetical protein
MGKEPERRYLFEKASDVLEIARAAGLLCFADGASKTDSSSIVEMV